MVRTVGRNLLIGSYLGHDAAVQVQLSAQGGVELLTAPQLLLQATVLPLQAVQSAGPPPLVLLDSSCRPRPIRRLLLA